MKKVLILLLCLLLPMAQASASYIETVQAGQPIYAGAGYDHAQRGTVSEKGRYTIVSEERDAAGRLWGKLKSGAGWIDLSDVRGEIIAPLTVAYAQGALPAGCSMYLQEDSQYVTWLVFNANQRLENVQLVSFAVAEEGLRLDSILYAQPALLPDAPLAAGVVFYGDMTTYGLLCTDSQGAARCYTLSVSGYDGSLVVNECALIAF